MTAKQTCRDSLLTDVYFPLFSAANPSQPKEAAHMLNPPQLKHPLTGLPFANCCTSCCTTSTAIHSRQRHSNLVVPAVGTMPWAPLAHCSMHASAKDRR